MWKDAIIVQIEYTSAVNIYKPEIILFFPFHSNPSFTTGVEGSVAVQTREAE